MESQLLEDRRDSIDPNGRPKRTPEDSRKGGGATECSTVKRVQQPGMQENHYFTMSYHA